MKNVIDKFVCLFLFNNEKKKIHFHFFDENVHVM